MRNLFLLFFIIYISLVFESIAYSTPVWVPVRVIASVSLPPDAVNSFFIQPGQIELDSNSDFRELAEEALQMWPHGTEKLNRLLKEKGGVANITEMMSAPSYLYGGEELTSYDIKVTDFKIGKAMNIRFKNLTVEELEDITYTKRPLIEVIDNFIGRKSSVFKGFNFHEHGIKSIKNLYDYIQTELSESAHKVPEELIAQFKQSAISQIIYETWMEKLESKEARDFSSRIELSILEKWLSLSNQEQCRVNILPDFITKAKNNVVLIDGLSVLEIDSIKTAATNLKYIYYSFYLRELCAKANTNNEGAAIFSSVWNLFYEDGLVNEPINFGPPNSATSSFFRLVVEKLYTDANPQLFMLAWNGLRSQGLITGNGDEHILQLVKNTIDFRSQESAIILRGLYEKGLSEEEPNLQLFGLALGASLQRAKEITDIELAAKLDTLFYENLSTLQCMEIIERLILDEHFVPCAMVWAYFINKKLLPIELDQEIFKQMPKDDSPSNLEILKKLHDARDPARFGHLWNAFLSAASLNEEDDESLSHFIIAKSHVR
jgi:hypothetical protein